MKSLFTFKAVLTCLLIGFIFTSCEKDGVYNPAKKIKRIYTASATGSKSLQQEWTWDKNMLSKVQYYFGNNSSSYYERYIYDGKILSKVDGSDGSYTKISYEGSFYDKWQYYDSKGQLELVYEFKRVKNKISEVKVTYYDYDNYKNSQSFKHKGFIISFIPEKMSEDIFEMKIKKSSDNGYMKSVETSTGTYTITYDGNNIKELKYFEAMDASSYYSLTYTLDGYDNKSNPFYGGNDEANGLSSIDLFLSFLKNNPVKATYRSTESDGDVDNNMYFSIDYSYSYDGKFPTEVTERSYPQSGNMIMKNIFYDYE